MSTARDDYPALAGLARPEPDERTRILNEVDALRAEVDRLRTQVEGQRNAHSHLLAVANETHDKHMKALVEVDRLRTENSALEEAAQAFRDLTIRYRMGRTPCEALFMRLETARELLAQREVGR